MNATSTSRFNAKVSNLDRFSGCTAKVILSCASETSISQGCKPSYFNGAPCNSHSQPLEYLPISPKEHDIPPAPLSVMHLKRPKSRASNINSYNFLCVNGSPICTA